MIFSTGKGMKIINWEQGFFVHRRIVSAVKRVKFISDRLSYIVLTGHWQFLLLPNRSNKFMNLQANCSTLCFNQFCRYMINTWRFVTF